jgi:hypothetical protein
MEAENWLIRNQHVTRSSRVAGFSFLNKNAIFGEQAYGLLVAGSVLAAAEPLCLNTSDRPGNARTWGSRRDARSLRLPAALIWYARMLNELKQERWTAEARQPARCVAHLLSRE